MFALKNGILHLQVKKITRNLPVFLRGTRKNKTEKAVNFLPDNYLSLLQAFFLQGQGVWKYQVFDSWCFRYLPYLFQTKITALLMCLISYMLFSCWLESLKMLKLSCKRIFIKWSLISFDKIFTINDNKEFPRTTRSKFSAKNEHTQSF